MALVALLTAGALPACAPFGRSEPAPDPSASCVEAPKEPLPGTAGSGEAAPDGGGLRVTESGVSFVPSGGGTPDTASLGVMVENTSEYAAYRTLIRFEVTDESGTAIATGTGSEALVLEVPLILPGAQVGVGTAAYLDEGMTVTEATQVTTHFGATTWVAANDAPAVAIETKHDSITMTEVESGSGYIDYQMTSPYCQGLVSRGVSSIFRDSSGKIVGGAVISDRGRIYCTAGTTEQTMNATYTIPDGIDESATSTYPYCDFSMEPTTPRPTIVPFN
ncbi:hypothetical protein O7623_17375 [Solwaraspora sp. WMMD791]|uniref:hypothetical protein n=1 Tax=Solwaraspora sp. WMMD791 TaxID=3016086 RepID=UPI00249C99FD|nr:hypothetical protein [Solwaraspora sp. WMMD791]WFE25179.1 hypothetical protein O7623_17375 [Solwaraspora sp. WMMD791]